MVFKDGSETALSIAINLSGRRSRPLHAKASNEEALRIKAISTFLWNKVNTKHYQGQDPQEFFEGFALLEVTDSVLVQSVQTLHHDGGAKLGYFEQLDLYAPRTYAGSCYIRPRLAYPGTIMSPMFGHHGRSIKVTRRFKDFCQGLRRFSISKGVVYEMRRLGFTVS